MTIYVKGKSKYVKSEIDQREYCKTSGHFAKHLACHGLTEKDYCVKYEGLSLKKCRFCDNDATFDKARWKFKDLCGSVACTTLKQRETCQLPEVKAKFSDNAKRLWQDPDIRDRMVKSQQEALSQVGDDGLTGYQHILQNGRRTKLERYGSEFYANPDKANATKACRTKEQKETTLQKRRSTLASKPEEEKQKVKSQVSATVMRKFGVPWATFLAAKNQNSNRFSKPELELCQALATMIEGECHYGGSEFGQLKLERFFYDFSFANKIIEFNGDFWHARPDRYQEDFINPFNKLTSKEIWEKDRLREELASSHGYFLKTVWESDYKRNPQQTIHECYEWLTN